MTGEIAADLRFRPGRATVTVTELLTGQATTAPLQILPGQTPALSVE